MNRYIIGSLWDRTNRNGANANFEYLFEGSKRVDALNRRAEGILTEAKQTNDMNVDVQNELDVFISEFESTGETNLEVVQARGNYTTLGQRVKRSDSDLEGRGINIMFPPPPLVAAIPFSGTDQTKIIKNILDNHNEIFIPEGDFEIHDMLEITTGKTVVMANKANLFKPDYANNNLPVVWLRGSNSSIIGSGMRNTSIYSERRSPLGVVRLGYSSMDDTTARAIMYNTITDFGIMGSTNGGETSGEQSIGLYMANPQVGDLPSYFHNISNLFFRDANSGILFEGWANANIINNMHFYRVGTDKRLNGGAMVFKETSGKGPLDNSISSVFHHGSINADTLVFDGSVIMNSMQNIISEQGGPLARYIYEKNTGSSRNIVSGLDNVQSGSDTSEDFMRKNTLTFYNRMFAPSITTIKTKSDEGTFENLTAGRITQGQYRQGTVEKNNLGENKKYEALKLDILNLRSVYIELKIVFHTSAILSPMWQTAKIGFSIKKDGAGNYDVTPNRFHDARGIFLQPFEENGKLVIGFKTGSNGTTTTATSSYIHYSVLGNEVEITENTGNTAINSGESLGSYLPITTQNGVTSSRPTTSQIGYQYFDRTISMPIWWNGSSWVDSRGASV